MPVGAVYSPRSPTNSGRTTFGFGPGRSADELPLVVAVLVVADLGVAPVCGVDFPHATTALDTSATLSANGTNFWRIVIRVLIA
jgi:hypothetical protein